MALFFQTILEEVACILKYLKSELGELDQSFNKIADDLLKSDKAIQESEERYREI
jgi:hypothetical protein